MDEGIGDIRLAEFRIEIGLNNGRCCHDQASSALGDLYCGCKWTWVGKSGGRIDAASCGYQTRKQQNRAERTEWEHIVPAHTFGNQRQCWKNGGREHCVDNDPVFREYREERLPIGTRARGRCLLLAFEAPAGRRWIAVNFGDRTTVDVQAGPDASIALYSNDGRFGGNGVAPRYTDGRLTVPAHATVVLRA